MCGECLKVKIFIFKSWNEVSIYLCGAERGWPGATSLSMQMGPRD